MHILANLACKNIIRINYLKKKTETAMLMFELRWGR